MLNVTADSFSDGGEYFSEVGAVERAFALLRDGATVVDVGGESTRPRGSTYGEGATPVSAEEQLRRVMPVVEALASAGAVVSVDTKSFEVARAVLAAGARIINDVSGAPSEALLRTVASCGAEIVIMHSRGGGEVTPENTRYDDVSEDIAREWRRERDRAVACGIAPERIWFDAGLGFAKTPAQSMLTLRQTKRFVDEGHRVLVAASRKSFLGQHVAQGGEVPTPKTRLGASVAAALFAARSGASAVRVHDVRETVQALRMEATLASGPLAMGALPDVGAGDAP